MQTKLVPTLFLTLSALAIAPFVVPAIAHQAQHQSTAAGDGEMEAMIHLDPSDSPAAGSPSETWFVLKANNMPVPLANCNCEVMIYDSRNQMIMHGLPLSETMIDGQAAIATEITFPLPGAYTVVLSGQAQDGSFEPFEIRFPVTSVASTSAY